MRMNSELFNKKFNAYICKPLARECAFTAWLNFFKMAETPNLNWTFCLVDITIRSFYFYLFNRHFFPIDTPIMKILTTFFCLFFDDVISTTDLFLCIFEKGLISDTVLNVCHRLSIILKQDELSELKTGPETIMFH